MKTAVEWLVIQLKKDLNPFEKINVIEQAKEMCKQQILKSYRDGRNDEQSSRARHNYDRNSLQYYNENFN
jgi:hypothetical protein